MTLDSRLAQVQAEWVAITRRAAPDFDQFAAVRREAVRIVDAGEWVSGPADLLSVLGRQRDELVHSRMIGWLLTPTGRHGLGRRFLTAFADHLWPEEQLFRSAVVVVEIETTRAAADELGSMHEARADILLHGGGISLLIENKLDAGEQPDQCERLYWAWADAPSDVRWVFLTPTGRAPVTATSEAARSGWRTMSYADLAQILASAIAAAPQRELTGRSSAIQYLATLDTSPAGAR